MPNKRATMSDVARRAGVSKSTVSHVINQTRFVSPQTAEKVRQSIDDLEFRPSQLARSLAARRTNTIGLLISDIDNPFYPQVIKGVEEIALAESYNVFLANVGYDTQRIINSSQSMLDRQIDGVICMSTRFPPELITQLASENLPSVFLDWQPPAHLLRSDIFATIQVDFETGIKQAVDHLISLGHRQFAHISGPQDAWTSRDRQQTFLMALREQGIPSNDVCIVEGNLQIDGGRAALERILKAPSIPTAVFCANDLSALGFLWEARQKGFSVPEDFSLIGLDDIPLSSQISPGLTTIALPIQEIGKEAMTTLLNMISHPASDENPARPESSFITTELIIRESTASPAGRNKP
jgi:DNA-binding LacI/PurR family transcriptional regulator